MHRLPSLLALMLLVGCSSSTFDVASSQDDSGLVGDSSGGDTSVGDTTTGDSAVADSPPVDVGGDSSVPKDTGSDGGKDTGTDTAPACPMPPNTKTVDVHTLSCDELSSKYAEAVLGAQSCGCALDCSVQVCDTFCCNCKSFVNPGSDAYAALTSLQKEFTARGCSTGLCPGFACGEPTLGGCGLGGGGPGGGLKCQTIRSGG